MLCGNKLSPGGERRNNAAGSKVKVGMENGKLVMVVHACMHEFALLWGFASTADADECGDVGRDDAALFHAAPRVERRRIRVRYWWQALVVIVVGVGVARNTHPVLGHHSVVTW